MAEGLLRSPMRSQSLLVDLTPEQQQARREEMVDTLLALPREAYETMSIPGNVIRGEYGVPSVDNPAFVDAGIKFAAADAGFLPSLAIGAVSKQAPNVLRMGAGPVSKTKETDPMVVMHNIHEVPIQKAQERGGIPVPSLAVVKADDPLLSFGEVSLIGDPSMARPSAKNPVYKTDAYTVRQPRTEVSPNKEAVDFVTKNFTGPVESIRYLDPRDVAESLINKDFDSYSDISLKAAFLRERENKCKLPLLRSLRTVTPLTSLSERQPIRSMATTTGSLSKRKK